MRDFARRPQARAPRRRSARGSRGRVCEWPAERQVKSTTPVRIPASIAKMNRELAGLAIVQPPELATRVRILKRSRSPLERTATSPHPRAHAPTWARVMPTILSSGAESHRAHVGTWAPARSRSQDLLAAVRRIHCSTSQLGRGVAGQSAHRRSEPGCRGPGCSRSQLGRCGPMTPTLGWISETRVLTDGEAISPGLDQLRGSGAGALREFVLVELAAGHRVRLV